MRRGRSQAAVKLRCNACDNVADADIAAFTDADIAAADIAAAAFTDAAFPGWREQQKQRGRSFPGKMWGGAFCSKPP